MFKNLKIIELASVLAGPAVGMFFAELGAKVIKIENKKNGGHITRGWKGNNEKNRKNLSAYYCSVNWNKKSLFLDITNASDYAQLLELIKTADIVIANFKHGKDTELKVDFNTLKQLNAALIYAKITGFSSSPNRVAYDAVLQAESGFMSINGQAGSPPTKMPIAMIDILAAHQLKEGILCALLNNNSSLFYHVNI